MARDRTPEGEKPYPGVKWIFPPTLVPWKRRLSEERTTTGNPLSIENLRDRSWHSGIDGTNG